MYLFNLAIGLVIIGMILLAIGLLILNCDFKKFKPKTIRVLEWMMDNLGKVSIALLIISIILMMISAYIQGAQNATI